MNLDEPDRFSAVDQGGALTDVERASAQWSRAAEIAPAPVDPGGRVDAVVVAGMGGSGIAGDVVRALAGDRLPVPVTVHKGYGLPAFAGPGTVVVAVSHSGNTEETRASVEAAIERGARLTAVTGGGAIGDLCDRHGIAWTRVPATGQPRHNLGSLVVPVLAALGLDDGLSEAVDLLADRARAWGREVPTTANPAKQLAGRVAAAGVTVAYGAVGIPGVAAYRLKCQLNENAKLPAFAAELPELDHNEIVGWQEPTRLPDPGLVWLRDPGGEHPRTAARVEVTSRVVGPRFSWMVEHAAVGSAPLARLASLLLYCDLVSVYTALALDRDPTPIPAIDRLKAELATRGAA